MWATIPIFKSDYDLVDFLVDISMDAAKAVVSGVVIGVIAGGLALASSPIVVTTFFIIALGLYLNNRLNHIEDDIGLSVELKKKNP